MISQDRDFRFRITRIFKTAVDQRYEIVSTAAERHGAWEWSASRRNSHGLNRFVSLGLIERNFEWPPVNSLETWAGADDGRRFTRRLAMRGQLPQWLDREELLSVSDRFVADAIELGLKLADSLTEADLTDAFLLPRLR
jgi:hypothetical protein